MLGKHALDPDAAELADAVPWPPVTVMAFQVAGEPAGVLVEGVPDGLPHRMLPSRRAGSCGSADLETAGTPLSDDEFRNTFGPWELHRSAFKHGVPDPDVVHAARHALVAFPIGEDPPRELHFGPDRAGNVLELVILLLDDGRRLVIHAMPMRRKYRPLMPDPYGGTP